MSVPQVGSPVNAFPTGPAVTEDCAGIPTEDLLELALAPESMSNADQSYTERSVDDLIKLDAYLKQRCAAKKNGGGWGQIRISKVVSPSSV